MTYVIAEPCIGTKDTACVDACPVDCIHPKKNTTYDDGRAGFDEVPQLYIDPVECIDCGACVPVCPVSAIFALDDLPEKWTNYAELNASYVEGGTFKKEEYANHQTAKWAQPEDEKVMRLNVSLGSILKQKEGEIWAITPDQSVYDAIEKMADKGVGAL